MLSFDIRALESQAIQVDDVLAPDDPVWVEGDPVPAAPVRVRGRLSTAGAGRFYFSGDLAGRLNAECRRCLTDVAAEVAERGVHLLFVESDDDETADDPDVYLLEPRARELDLRPAIREHWLLTVPGFVECRPDCKGLCPTCGADLNAGQCDCALAETDNRWDALRGPRPDAE
ncbi:MAG: YceD family protein [Gemmatimonadaceae bacterium]